MKQLTVKDLFKMCEAQIKGGNGDKKILISDDDEGNGYHELFYGMTDNTRSLFDVEWQPNLPFNVKEENYDEYVVLG